MQKKTTKPQSKPPVDREAVRVLAIELGAREAARKLGLNENTVLSWARRENWNLPKRTGGPKTIELQSKPGDVLIASHKQLEGATKTGLMLTAAKAGYESRRESASGRVQHVAASGPGQFIEPYLRVEYEGRPTDTA